MPELIDRNKLRETICAACPERLECTDMGDVCFEIASINTAPTIEAEPVRHGRWIELPKALNPAENPCQCSACKHILSFYYTTHKSNFCPNCGADMREGGAENG